MELYGGSFRLPCSRCALHHIKCGRSLLQSLLQFQHLHTSSCRRIPFNYPPSYQVLCGPGATPAAAPDGLAQLLSLAGS
eukprot:365661-Chlamydomonas_euryale.AAC.57